ncbi:DUF6049 family protein [Lysinibacter sp. HNR]|uniref:DUF6049 family protein n=1 Tax=Lysinibacter sp. HNR TaxID=3031408 RepID=UPI0024352631|nr:DUF6049 family protein [Lysinibacter sp. HNR]WGD37333.1 DUF6049 family protein [Lysinibacter sp. HNR]
MFAARKTRSRVLRYPQIMIGAALTSAAVLLTFTLSTGQQGIFPPVDASAKTTSLSEKTTDSQETTSEESSIIENFSVSVASSSPVIATDQDTVSVLVNVDNHTDQDVSNLNVAVHIDRDRITDSTFLTTLANTQNESPAGLGTVIYTGAIGKVAKESSVSETFTFTTAALGLNPSEPGVYSLSANITGSDIDTTLSARSAVVWGMVAEPSSLVVSSVVPLMLPPDIFGLATGSQLADLTGQNGSLTQSLSAAISVNATLAIDPRVIASIRILGEGAPTSAKEWLKRLATTANPSFALQFSDADLAAQSQLDLQHPLTVKNLDAFTPSNNGEQSPNSTTVFPTVNDLTSWPYTLPPTAWPTETVVDNDLVFFTDNGFNTALLGSNNVEGLSRALTTDRALINNTESLVVNSEVTHALGQQLETTNATDFAARAGYTAAELALIAQQGGGTRQHILVAFDRSTIATGTRIIDTAATLTSLSWVQALFQNDALSALTPEGGSPPEAMSLSLKERVIDTDRLDTLRKGLEYEARVISFSQVLESPQLLIGTQSTRILNLFSTAIATPDDTFARRTVGYFHTDRKTLDSVRINPSKPITVAATQSEIPIQVNNELPYPVLVNVHATASNNRILIKDATESTRIEATSQSIIRVPVSARVSNGETMITVSLSTGDGTLIGTPMNIPLSIRAQWEAVGLAILAILVASFFGFGAWRSIRNRRREKRAKPEPSPPAQDLPHPGKAANPDDHTADNERDA